MEPEEAYRRILHGLDRRRNMLIGTTSPRVIEVTWLEPTTDQKDSTMPASLNKRIEALEAIKNPRTPIILFEPYDPTRSQQAAFDAKLEATKVANPGRQVMIFRWAAAE